jgi:hypothetical protein
MSQAESTDTTRSSRRRFLMTAPAAAVAVGKLTAPSTDFGLLSLERTTEAIAEKANVLWSKYQEIEEAVGAQCGPLPGMPPFCEGDDLRAQIAECDKRRRAWKARRDQIERDLGYREARAHSDGAEAALARALAQIKDTPATTLEGLASKARWSHMTTRSRITSSATSWRSGGRDGPDHHGELPRRRALRL